MAFGSSSFTAFVMRAAVTARGSAHEFAGVRQRYCKASRIGTTSSRVKFLSGMSQATALSPNILKRDARRSGSRPRCHFCVHVLVEPNLFSSTLAPGSGISGDGDYVSNIGGILLQEA